MKRVFNLLVVDESGSMSIIERQAGNHHYRWGGELQRGV